MKTILFALFAPAFLVMSQPTVAPTNESTDSPRGTNVASYNIQQSFELGYRFATTGGNGDMYRSTVNYTNGIRLLSSSLFVQSREGHGRWFDQLSLSTQGLGNDPYESAVLRVEKNKAYRYDLHWRLNKYFNPALEVSAGQHALYTTHRFQDHDFTLFPESPFKLFLGYSRVTQDGTGLSTLQFFEARGDEFPLFTRIRREQNEYRLGGEAKLLGFRLNVMRGWVDFKEDSILNSGAQPGNNRDDLTELASLRKDEPVHGTSPYWRVGLFREGKKFWAANGRFTYVAGKHAFVQDELARGIGRLGANASTQVVVLGDARRPALTGNFTLSLFPTEAITITNQTSVSNIRLIGNALFQLFTNGSTTPAQGLPFSLLGILNITNSTLLDVRLRPWLGVYAGYDYGDRRIRSIEGIDPIGRASAPRILNEQTNILQAGTFGIRLRPLKPLSIHLGAEIGRANHPLFPIADKDYHALNGRILWRTKLYRVGAYARSNYNTNSNSLTSFASRARQYGAEASWTAREWFSLDASYTKLHLNTLGGLDFFVALSNEVEAPS
ncbi:MAG TPA: hypothetical protein VGP79_05005, partial [Bryobacteraceae bacterium]|nr:hypothetical protein [Bryobacteraceae bacterium]